MPLVKHKGYLSIQRGKYVFWLSVATEMRGKNASLFTCNLKGQGLAARSVKIVFVDGLRRLRLNDKN